MRNPLNWACHHKSIISCTCHDHHHHHHNHDYYCVISFLSKYRNEHSLPWKRRGEAGGVFIFTYICGVFFLAMPQACGILLPWPGIEPVAPAVEAWSLNHWTARQDPNIPLLCCHMVTNFVKGYEGKKRRLWEEGVAWSEPEGCS